MPVGRSHGLSDFGNHDMAGNAKEWCWNESLGGSRHTVGGSFGEPTYTFKMAVDSALPLSRLPNVGFRCARYPAPPEALMAPVVSSIQHGTAAEAGLAHDPVSDEIFEAYRRMYAYDRTDLAATVERVDDSSPHWRKETVSFAAAYGGERVIVHLFLPRNAEPPYQPVVWYPGADAYFLPPGDALASTYLFDFVPRSGRALVYPVYKGTYERHVAFSFAPNEWRDMVIMWSKDLSRTVDYLQQRPDMDAGKLGYYGFSAGALYGPIFTAIDGRFRASVLLSGGLIGGTPPEMDPVNFAPRCRVPTLMVNGHDDYTNPFETSQSPLLDLIGTADDDKRIVRLPGGHIPPDRLAIVEEVVSWFDRYLGPVQTRRRGSD